MAVKILAPDVSNWPVENPQLIGGQCGDCDAVIWPKQGRCSRCGSLNMSDLPLARRGTLVAWTTQGFIPKLPYAGRQTAETFVPYGVGLVQLGSEVRVEARLTEADPSKLRFGMEVELVFVPFFVDEEGDQVVTWAFQPV